MATTFSDAQEGTGDPDRDSIPNFLDTTRTATVSRTT
jgi:hypothetical protein